MALSLGYRCSSNMERGLGRYDLWVSGPSFDAVMEFKRAASEQALGSAAEAALAQIDDRRYAAPARAGSRAGDPRRPSLPLYKIGVACFKAMCAVKTAKG
jgi:hypothetical protein